MKKRTIKSVLCVLLTLAMVAALPVTASAANYNKPTDSNPVAGIGQMVYYTGAAITLDGVADEAAWAGAPWSSAFMEETAAGFAYVTGNGALSNTRFKALWDGKYQMYLYIEVDDNTYHVDDAFRFVISEDSTTGTCYMGGAADGSDKTNATIVKVDGVPTGQVTWGDGYKNRFATFALKRGAAGQGVRYASNKFQYAVTEKADHSGYIAECVFHFTVDISSGKVALGNIAIDDFTAGQDSTLYSVSNNANYLRYTDTPTYYSWSGLTTWRIGVTGTAIRATDNAVYARQANSTNSIWKNSMGQFWFVTTNVPAEQKTVNPDFNQTIYKTDAAIALDGNKEAVWDTVEWFSDLHSGNDSIAKFKAVWKEEDGKKYVYFYIDVNDGTLVELSDYRADGVTFQFNELKQDALPVLKHNNSLGYYVFSTDTSVNSEHINALTFYGIRRSTTVNRGTGDVTMHDNANSFIEMILHNKEDPKDGYIIEAKYTVLDNDLSSFWFNLSVIDGEESGTAYKKYHWTDGGFAFSNEVFYAPNAGTVTLSDKAPAADYAVQAGAAVRYDLTDPSASTSGLRFETWFSKAYLASLTDAGKTYQIGTLILPESYLETYGLSKDEVTIEALEAKGLGRNVQNGYLDIVNEDGILADSGLDYAISYGTIAPIRAENYDRGFFAVGYICVDGVYTYCGASETRTIKFVAAAALADTDAGYSDAVRSVLQAYVGE